MLDEVAIYAETRKKMSHFNVGIQVAYIFIYSFLMMLTDRIIHHQTVPHKEQQRMHKVSFLLFPWAWHSSAHVMYQCMPTFDTIQLLC